MTWASDHDASEKLASSAHEALLRNDEAAAKACFAAAALAEQSAFQQLGNDKPRTLGILSVSATALWYKASRFDEAEQVAHHALTMPALPAFARRELRSLLQAIWDDTAHEEAGISFFPGQVAVALRGGKVLRGGAPVDLIISKVQTVQSLYYRTAEYLTSLPLRKKGPPTRSIQELCTPWLFQAPPGSYRFVVAVQRSEQQDLFDSAGAPSPGALTDALLNILRSMTEESPDAMDRTVPAGEYRAAFLKLARNLTPTKSLAFTELEIGTDTQDLVRLSLGSRERITERLRQGVPTDRATSSEAYSFSGILRAVDLERDWIEVHAGGVPTRINGVGESLDDVLGPMVNHQVTVRVAKGTAERLTLLDIEQDE